MKREKFIKLVTACGGAVAVSSVPGFTKNFISLSETRSHLKNKDELTADVIICGGGLGGCAAALAALRNNLKVIMTEETDWIGGQLTQQGVPPDEHEWIETHGCTKLYRDFRSMIRKYYFDNYPLTDAAHSNRYLNPGDGAVSRLCHEPRVAHSVLQQLFAPYISSKKLVILTKNKITRADVQGNKVRSLESVSQLDGNILILSAPYFIDATELGDILPLTGTEFITGTESHKETGELHAPEKANPDNVQAFTLCFAMEYLPGENHLINKPSDYNYWRDFKPELTPPWPGKLFDLTYTDPVSLKPRTVGFNPEPAGESALFNMWNYRRIINKDNFKPGTFPGDISIVNWPQNDFLKGNLIGATPEEFKKYHESARQLSLSLFYWLQTEAPRPDKGYGWPGLRLRGDVLGTGDGLAMYPYIRESRRIRALFTVLEEHVGIENRSLLLGKSEGIKAASFYDSVGVGYYRIDLHPSNNGNNYIDVGSLPFQIPLGSLIPVRMENLLPANKNIGTTHITNGCYRLHPVEWNVGESAGSLAAFSINKKVAPREVRSKNSLLEEFQSLIRSQGIETHWPQQ